jgi:hypothetical protein
MAAALPSKRGASASRIPRVDSEPSPVATIQRPIAPRIHPSVMS